MAQSGSEEGCGRPGKRARVTRGPGRGKLSFWGLGRRVEVRLIVEVAKSWEKEAGAVRKGVLGCGDGRGAREEQGPRERDATKGYVPAEGSGAGGSV